MRDLKGFVETRQQLLTLKPNHRMNWIGFSVAHHLNSKYSSICLTCNYVLQLYQLFCIASQYDIQNFEPFILQCTNGFLYFGIVKIILSEKGRVFLITIPSNARETFYAHICSQRAPENGKMPITQMWDSFFLWVYFSVPVYYFILSQ